MLKTKYLLPLILILCLLFAIPTYGADLFSTYDQRIKLTIDHTKIDSDLTWFPITLFITDAQMEEVFAEFDADADFDRCAITTSDESTQIYGDCERFDDSASKGIYHVAKEALVTDANAAGYLYFYFDNDAGHNTSYISMSGGVAAQKVWNDEFEGVWHKQDATTSTILDSTSNNNDGTKYAANQPVEATGQVGKAQTYDGTDDYIDLGTNATLNQSGNMTIECLVKANSDYTSTQQVFSNYYDDPNEIEDKCNYILEFGRTDKRFSILQNSGYVGITNSTDVDDDNWHHIVFTRNGSAGDWDLAMFLDGVADGTVNAYAQDPEGGTNPTSLGRLGDASLFYYKGTIDEARLSSVARNAAWTKGTTNTLLDTLLTYGNKESAPSGTHIFFTLGDF